MRYGLRRALWSAPREKYGDAVAACMLAGLILTVLARERMLLAWYAVGLASVLPLAWTALANPIRRIPATALLAFGVVAVAGGTAVVLAAVTRQAERRRASAPTSRS
jgi:O-antigen ligase